MATTPRRRRRRESPRGSARLMPSRSPATTRGRGYLLYGDKAETDFPPEESEHVVLPEEVMRQINALKAGRGRLQ